MFALYKISSNTVIHQWDHLPSEISIPQANVIAFSPSPTWAHGDYKLIPVVYKEEARTDLSIEPPITTQSVVITKGKPTLEIKLTYNTPSLSESKRILEEQLNEKIKETIPMTPLHYAMVFEAYEFQRDAKPDANNYPLLSSMIGKTLQEAATITLENFKTYRHETANIIKKNHEAKNALKRATNVKAALTAVSQISIVPPEGWKE